MTTSTWRLKALGSLTLLLALLVLPSCATRPLPVRDSSAAAEIAALKSRLLELQRQVTVHEVEIERLRARVAELDGGRAPRESNARPPARRPAGREEVSARPSQPRQSRPQEARPPAPSIDSSDLPTVDLDLPAANSPSGSPAPPLPGPGSSAPQRPLQPASSEAQALYDQGYSLFHQGRYVDAEAAFQRFLRSHGDTDLADNAGYWIGESRYAREDYRGALSIYRETLERHPTGNKVPDILLKMGICLENLGDLGGARDVYDELIRRYPGSGASVTAEERRSALP